MHVILESKPIFSLPSLLNKIKYKQVKFGRIKIKTEILDDIDSIEVNYSSIKDTNIMDYRKVHLDLLYLSEIEKLEDNLNKCSFY